MEGNKGNYQPRQMGWLFAFLSGVLVIGIVILPPYDVGKFSGSSIAETNIKRKMEQMDVHLHKVEDELETMRKRYLTRLRKDGVVSITSRDHCMFTGVQMFHITTRNSLLHNSSS
jgi:hypothetical protein